ncbi:hypothetical protein E0485_15095 [Paenibacillus albiflavus]|uniref:ArpU family transcriptional regulator n=1 Tax=Paenibacillus albiflavus TaxID=2545760 RepID=A0A4V2WNN8_9BACL|nr:ArpU family phage packaging/lysis transcriptional regulator [Paenibacillus albiflavus]TCZ76162.1 hypothetical protein E0485_15095 [Paenibacillus albiflavus]
MGKGKRAVQISMSIYRIDEDATKRAVEKYLIEAREYQVTEYIPMEQKITAAYEPQFRDKYAVSSPVANIAIKNVDESERRSRHVDRAERAVNRLGTLQQQLVRMRYLDDDNVSDTEVALQLGYSDRHYRRIKSLAIYRLANTLGLVVLVDEEAS